jgi:hypothetical protein
VQAFTPPPLPSDDKRWKIVSGFAPDSEPCKVAFCRRESTRRWGHCRRKRDEPKSAAIIGSGTVWVSMVLRSHKYKRRPGRRRTSSGPASLYARVMQGCPKSKNKPEGGNENSLRFDYSQPIQTTDGDCSCTSSWLPPHTCGCGAAQKYAGGALNAAP